MGHPDNYIPANPMVTPAHIVPEWYFLPFYAILRAVPDKLLGVLAMFNAIGVLFILPWLDRSPVRSATFRPIYKIMFWVFLVNCVALTYLGAKPAEGIYVILSRLCTVYYFSTSLYFYRLSQYLRHRGHFRGASVNQCLEVEMERLRLPRAFC